MGMAEIVAMGATLAERAIVSLELGGMALIWDGRQSKELPGKNNFWARNSWDEEGRRTECENDIDTKSGSGRTVPGIIAVLR